MSNITPFSSDEFELSILPDGDSFRVLAPGLAHALGMRDATRLLENIPEAEKGYTTACTPGGEQRVGYVTEAGFYRALGQRQAARVKNPEIRDQVERFQSWVYTEVLPAIRRTGTYATTPSVPQPDLSELSPRNLAYLSELAKGLEAAVKHAEKNQRKADGYDHFLNGSGCYLVDTAANLLGVKHRRLWEWLTNILESCQVLVSAAQDRALPDTGLVAMANDHLGDTITLLGMCIDNLQQEPAQKPNQEPAQETLI